MRSEYFSGEVTDQPFPCSLLWISTERGRKREFMGGVLRLVKVVPHSSILILSLIHTSLLFSEKNKYEGRGRDRRRKGKGWMVLTDLLLNNFAVFFFVCVISCIIFPDILGGFQYIEQTGIKNSLGRRTVINYPWCDCDNVQKFKSFCSPSLEYLTIKCRPYYLPR
jgi:hypothetical protein